MGGSVMVMTQSSPHVLQNVTDALTLVAFGFLCYAVYRVYRHPGRARAHQLGLMTALLAVATMFDADHRTPCRHHLQHALPLPGRLRSGHHRREPGATAREPLQVETELQLYRTHMDELVETRVRELDVANALLARETEERHATEEALHRRMEELDTLQRMAQLLGGQTARGEALDEATSAIARLFRARYARVRLLRDDEADEDEAGAGTGAMREGIRGGAEDVQPLTALDLAVCEAVLRDQSLIADDIASWPGLPDDLRSESGAAGVGSVLAAPLTGTSGPAGALVIARGVDAGPFSAEDQQLAGTVGDALAAVIEIDRLHRQETRQAAAEERQALARDLHDAVTQSIYSATLIAEALPAVWERDHEEGLRNLERLRRLVRAALAEMRTLLFELRPAALESAPLDALIERLGDALAGQTQIDVDIELDDVELPPGVKIAFYRVTQEAFSNIAKHARASTVSARVVAIDGGATLTVRDDGRGFDPGAVPSGHMGLHIMNERLERVAATLRVDSAPGAGTTIHAAWLQPASDERPLERMGA